MKIHEAIGTKLSGDSGVTALVGDRVYLSVAYQEPEYPLILWIYRTNWLVDLGHELTNKADLSVACFAENADDAVAVSDAVKAALHKKNETWGTLYINSCVATGMSVDSVDTGDGTFLVLATIDFSLLYGPES